MIDTETFVGWLQAMVETLSQKQYNDDFSVGAKKTCTTIIELIEAGAFKK
ncbi:hypothetical protein [Pelosinus propionicus]|uniref:Uncharacterized protein n=1 Tax=Pelosinus propionicus DSM 13327 TaxID=1123291 RepID=A0A1I4PSV9_9FIRM|nr:hypothetical protein [Pelosinus propionicus]SFM30857.1 hypothetical protein SAMN04490355_10729 [Pelosinus propionicus DSM 13327]